VCVLSPAYDEIDFLKLPEADRWNGFKEFVLTERIKHLNKELVL